MALPIAKREREKATRIVVHARSNDSRAPRRTEPSQRSSRWHGGCNHHERWEEEDHEMQIIHH
jgi:hypothetical protein